MRVQNRDTFGWQLFIKNPLASEELAELVPGSTRLSLGEVPVQGRMAPTRIMTAEVVNPEALGPTAAFFRWLGRTRRDFGRWIFSPAKQKTLLRIWRVTSDRMTSRS